MSALTLWRRAKKGTVALEFALISSIFLGLLLLIFELGFIFFAQTALDYAARETARQMQTGQANPADQAHFQSDLFCLYLNPFLNCGQVTIVLQPVTNFQTAMSTVPTSPYNSGSPGSLMLLQATYTPGLPLWPLSVAALVGTAAYQNE